MSLILKFCEALGEGIGTVLSHKVKKDLDYVRNMEDKAFYATKSFDERISELETDKFLGSLYLYELIDKSKKLEHLQAIRGYLDTEEKTTNIPNEQYYNLLRKVNIKINEQRKEDELMELLNYLKTQKESM
jgi:hypothetical protein